MSGDLSYYIILYMRLEISSHEKDDSVLLFIKDVSKIIIKDPFRRVVILVPGNLVENVLNSNKTKYD